MPSTRKTAAPRTYDFLSEHHWYDSNTFPSPAALIEAEEALGAVQEFMIDPILCGIATTVKASGDALTDEQIGSLVVWADQVHTTAKRVAEAAVRVSYLARESYAGCDVPISKSGHVDDADYYRRSSASLVSFGDDVA